MSANPTMHCHSCCTAMNMAAGASAGGIVDWRVSAERNTNCKHKTPHLSDILSMALLRAARILFVLSLVAGRLRSFDMSRVAARRSSVISG